jgi:hypothetical protein
MAELLRALAFKLNGPKFHNAAFGEALWEVARRATTRHIENPDEMLNQQVRGEREGRSWGRRGCLPSRSAAPSGPPGGLPRTSTSCSSRRSRSRACLCTASLL